MISTDAMPDKSEIARVLAEAHRNIEPAISRIIRLVADGDREHDSREPIKLLEVNPDTSPSGILPIAFGADPPRVPFPSVIIEVTEAEFDKIRNGSLFLPDGWKLGDTLYPTAA
ncbi:MAG TPA: hypothetical protein VG759_24005 [Candidatus Angelobacter sp.]|jgi:hypothetical protein|nr:hypothetical protein [Candidatus Angelobacter sp.]